MLVDLSQCQEPLSTLSLSVLLCAIFRAVVGEVDSYLAPRGYALILSTNLGRYSYSAVLL